VRAGRRIVELQKQLLDTREALQVQATRDYLTQLWNRSAILDILDRELARARRESTAIGVVLADLDAFKTINDTYGHLAGDAVLRQAAARMQSSVRQYDSIGRYGGEEFVILLPGADEETVKRQAARMRVAIRENPIILPEHSLNITCSFGCTVGYGDDITAEMLIREADTALYRAKRSGRDRVEFVPLPLSIATAVVAG
jgi:diguanylate cyclase (GGDEF)-like protein